MANESYPIPPTSAKAAYAMMCIHKSNSGSAWYGFKHVDQPELAGLSVSAGDRIVPQRGSESPGDRSAP